MRPLLGPASQVSVCPLPLGRWRIPSPQNPGVPPPLLPPPPPEDEDDEDEDEDEEEDELVTLTVRMHAATGGFGSLLTRQRGEYVPTVV